MTDTIGQIGEDVDVQQDAGDGDCTKVDVDDNKGEIKETCTYGSTLLTIIDTNTIGEIVDKLSELQDTGDGNCTKVDADDDNINNMGEIQE